MRAPEFCRPSRGLSSSPINPRLSPWATFWRTFGAGPLSRRFHQSEIHLFLERVHLVNLHDDFVAELDDAPGAAADEMPALRLEDEKIILDRRQMHQPAHAEFGHFHKKVL